MKKLLIAVSALLFLSAPAQTSTQGLQVTWLNNSQVGVTCDHLRIHYTDIYALDISLSLTISGNCGLDTGSEASSTFYAIWILASEAGDVGAVLSISDNAPTLPAAYTLKRRVGWVLNNASGNIYRFYHIGDWWWWNESTNAAPFIVLNAGSSASLTAVGASGCVPPTSSLMWATGMVIQKNAAAARTWMRVRATGSNAADNNALLFVIVDEVAQNDYIGCQGLIKLNTSQSFDYRVGTTDQDGYVYVRGYCDPI